MLSLFNALFLFTVLALLVIALNIVRHTRDGTAEPRKTIDQWLLLAVAVCVVTRGVLRHVGFEELAFLPIPFAALFWGLQLGRSWERRSWESPARHQAPRPL